VAEAWNLAATE